MKKFFILLFVTFISTNAFSFGNVYQTKVIDKNNEVFSLDKARILCGGSDYNCIMAKIGESTLGLDLDKIKRIEFLGKEGDKFTNYTLAKVTLRSGRVDKLYLNTNTVFLIGIDKKFGSQFKIDLYQIKTIEFYNSSRQTNHFRIPAGKGILSSR